MVRAANELDLQTKLFGGGMVGLQFASLQTSLGPMLNGIVNYDFWVPEPTLDFPGIEELLAKYQERAEGQGSIRSATTCRRSPTPTCRSWARRSTRSAASTRAALEHIHKTTFETVVGPVQFGANGEWAKTRALMVQFQNITSNDLEQFKHAGKRVVLYPKDGSPASSSFPTPKPKRNSARRRPARRARGRWTCS